MKAALKAGVELDLLNRDELRAELGVQFGWLAEAARGVRFRDFSVQGVVPAAGPWTLTTDAGPEVGFIWAITRVAVSGAAWNPAANTYAVFKDEASPTKLVVDGLTRGRSWQVPELVLLGGSRLVATGTGTAAADIVISGAAVEIPVQFGWRLL